MTKFVLLAALLMSAPLAAQTAPRRPPTTPPASTTPAPVAAIQHVRLSTSGGDIIIAVDNARAPATAANFLRYVDQRRMDGVNFYRAMRMGDGGLVQGGTRGDRARVLRGVAHEPTSATGLSHTDGAISMARGAPGTADGDFFIIVGSQMTGLDANPTGAGDNQGFAVFGRVVAGMDIVRTILAAPTSPTEGVGVMRGQMLSPAIRITAARRIRPDQLPITGPATAAPVPTTTPPAPPQTAPRPQP
jgi:peptidyl-prolyl cis-trans isomerase A (cyclophilin A)